jgi:hypothetical protein
MDAKRQKSDDPPYDGGDDEDDGDDGDDDNGEDDEEEPPPPAPSDADTPGADLSKEITALPEPRQSQEEATAKVFEVMKARGATQTAVCIRLSLSPVYFSMWLRHKDIPKSTAALYTAALEQWLDDPAVFIRHARITKTNPAQVPRPSKSASGERPKKRGRPAKKQEAESDPDARMARPDRPERSSFFRPINCHALLLELGALTLALALAFTPTLTLTLPLTLPLTLTLTLTLPLPLPLVLPLTRRAGRAHLSAAAAAVRRRPLLTTAGQP